MTDKNEYVPTGLEKEVDFKVIKERLANKQLPPARTLSQTIDAFTNAFGPEIPIIEPFQAVIQEILAGAHFAVSDARFEYDLIFGTGFYGAFVKAMTGYPYGDEEIARIWQSMAKAVSLDPQKVIKDHNTAIEWIGGKPEKDILLAWEAASAGKASAGSMEETAVMIKTNPCWQYSRLWGAGLYLLMEKAGVDPDQKSITKWMNALDANYKIGGPRKCFMDYTQWKAAIARLEDAMKLFKEAEIRKKKELAARLEAQARELEKKEREIAASS